MAYCSLAGREEGDNVFRCRSPYTYAPIALDCFPRKQGGEHHTKLLGGEHHTKLLGRFFISYQVLARYLEPRASILDASRSHHLQTEMSIRRMPAPTS